MCSPAGIDRGISVRLPPSACYRVACGPPFDRIVAHAVQGPDHGAVVGVAVAGGLGRFSSRRWVSLSGRPARPRRRLEDQSDVLQVLREPGLRAKVALDHLAAFGVHDPRVGHAAHQHLQGRLRVQPDGLGEHQPLGQRGPVQAQHEVADQLHLCPAAARAGVDVFCRAAVEQVAAGVERLARPADDRRHLAAASLLAGAGDRSVEVLHAAGGQPGSQPGRLLGLAGRRVDQDLPRPQPVGQPVEHFLDRVRRVQTDQHPVADGQRVVRPPRPAGHQRLGLFPRPIVTQTAYPASSNRSVSAVPIRPRPIMPTLLVSIATPLLLWLLLSTP